MKRGLVFVDLDYTLTDFVADSACELIRYLYGDRVHDVFKNSFDLLMRHGQKRTSSAENQEVDAFAQFLTENIISTEGFVHRDLTWSREGALAYYLRDLKPPDIEQIVAAFWEQIGRGGKLYPDARLFLHKLQAAHFNLFVATAGDGRMKFDREKGLWCYDPASSVESKRTRIALGEIHQELRREQIIVFEPYAKTEAQSWQRLERSFGKFDSNVWMIGDSYIGDLVALKTYAPQVRTVLLDRNKKYGDRTNYPLADYVVDDLSTIASLILSKT